MFFEQYGKIRGAVAKFTSDIRDTNMGKFYQLEGGTFYSQPFDKPVDALAGDRFKQTVEIISRKAAVISDLINAYFFKQMVKNVIHSLIDNCDMGSVHTLRLMDKRVHLPVLP